MILTEWEKELNKIMIDKVNEALKGNENIVIDAGKRCSLVEPSYEFHGENIENGKMFICRVSKRVMLENKEECIDKALEALLKKLK